MGHQAGEELERVHGLGPGGGPITLVGAIGDGVGVSIIDHALQGHGIPGAVVGQAEGKGSVLLGHADAGMNVEAGGDHWSIPSVCVSSKRPWRTNRWRNRIPYAFIGQRRNVAIDSYPRADQKRGRTVPPKSEASSEQQDLSKLLDEVRKFAGDLVSSAGGFPPFASTLGADGKPGLVYLEPSPGQSGQDHINRLVTAVREQALAEKLRAAGVAYMVSAEVDSKPISAILVSVQHRSGKPLEVIIPFSRSGKSIEFGEPVVQPGKQAIFS